MYTYSILLSSFMKKKKRPEEGRVTERESKKGEERKKEGEKKEKGRKSS